MKLPNTVFLVMPKQKNKKNDFEEDGDDETTEYDILSYAKTYLEPKQQELQTIWTQKMEEMQ